MSFTWRSATEPPAFTMTPAGYARLTLRGAVIGALMLSSVAGLLLLRLAERPLHGARRPWSGVVPQILGRAVLGGLGIRLRTEGRRMTQPGALVANHASWLDIFVLDACARIAFVAKSEVAGWPGIGFLAKIAGTVFVARDPRQARAQQDLLEAQLRAGRKLLIFPEATSSDGFRVLPFKSTLFQAFFSDALRHEAQIQPVTVIYTAPPGQDPRFYGWWGDMEFADHVVRVLAAPAGGVARVVFHPPVRVADFASRKALAAHLAGLVRAGMPPDRRAMA